MPETDLAKDGLIDKLEMARQYHYVDAVTCNSLDRFDDRSVRVGVIFKANEGALLVDVESDVANAGFPCRLAILRCVEFDNEVSNGPRSPFDEILV